VKNINSKYLKRVLSICMTLMISIISIISVSMINATTINGTVSNTNSESGDFAKEAEILEELGLFNGSDIGFELDRLATRVEAGVIIVRLLGAEDEALKADYYHPFTDVPEWADPYIGYLYNRKLTKGTGNNLYGSYDFLSPDQFMTFCLRSISYKDTEGDFLWSEALEKSFEIDMVSSDYYSYLSKQSALYRDDIVGILFNLLNQKYNGRDLSLIDFLITQKVTTLGQALDLGVYRQPRTFTVTGTIVEIHNELKGVIVDQRNGVSFLVKIPFGEIETPYIGNVVIKDSSGITYSVIISKKAYYNNLLVESYEIGDSIEVTADLAIDIQKSHSIVRTLLIEK